MSSLLHPSNYFYHNKEASKSDVLYDVIKMKEFKFNFDNEEVQACVYIGNLLNRGILSNLTNDIILSLKFSETKNILKICKMIDHARTSLRILSYSNLFQFSSIELKGFNNQYVGRITENQIPNIHYRTMIKSNKLYFNNIIEKVFNNIYNLDVSKLKFINYDYSEEEYYIILINLFSVFESNFKIKFKEYRVPKFDDDQLSTINQCVLFLNQLKENNNNQEQFIESLKNRIETYNNSLYNKLKYALDYYCKKLIDENKIPLISTRVEWLYYKTLFDKGDLENKNVEISSQRLYQLRNEFVHDSKMPALNKLEEFG